MAEYQDFVAYLDQLISTLSPNPDTQSRDRSTTSKETLIRILRDNLRAWESLDQSQGVQVVTLQRKRDNEEERTFMLKQQHKAMKEDGARVREELKRVKEELKRAEGGLKRERTKRRELMNYFNRFKYELRRAEEEAKEKEKVRRMETKERMTEVTLAISLVILWLVLVWYLRQFT